MMCIELHLRINILYAVVWSDWCYVIYIFHFLTPHAYDMYRITLKDKYTLHNSNNSNSGP